MSFQRMRAHSENWLKIKIAANSTNELFVLTYHGQVHLKPDNLEQFESVHVGHMHVTKDDIELVIWFSEIPDGVRCCLGSCHCGINRQRKVR